MPISEYLHGLIDAAFVEEKFKRPQHRENKIMNSESIAVILFCLNFPVAAGAYYLWQQYYKHKATIKTLQASNSAFEKRVSLLSSEITEAGLGQWLEEITGYRYRNEIEVEVKFVYPMVRFLRYTPNDTQIRVPVTVQVGRNKNIGHADWVLLKNGDPYVIIEVKADTESLDNNVQSQARSYAFALNAPKYVLTNGKQLAVYLRGVQSDSVVVNCSVSELGRHWAIVKQELG